MAGEHPNTAVARRLWSAIAAGDADALAEVLAPDVEWQAFGHHPLSGKYYGHEAVCDYMANLGDAADELVSTLQGIYANDDGVVVAYHVSARRGARSLEMDYLLRLWIRNGRVFRARSVAMGQDETDRFWR